jgi:hypothetical protein
VLRNLGLVYIQVVPEYHFFMYFTSFEAAFAGIGLVKLIDRIWGRNTGRWQGASLLWRVPSLRYVLACAVLIAASLPGYLNSADLKQFRLEALHRMSQSHLNDFYAWARSHSRPGDVFLADNVYGLFAVAPTGRKVVSIYHFYANPYVDIHARDRARSDLFEALNRTDLARFRELARAANVRYVIAATPAEACCQVRAELPSSWFQMVFAQGPLRVYQLHDAGP